MFDSTSSPICDGLGRPFPLFQCMMYENAFWSMNPIGNTSLYEDAYMRNSVDNCRMLLRQAVLLAASRARARVGSRIAMRTAIMPITTSSSTSVKALGRRIDISQQRENVECRKRL